MFGLSVDQQAVWDKLQAGQNVFVTAKAGAGKSHLVNYIRENFSGRTLITGSTGIAANAIGGRTLHSQFRINPNCPDIKESVKSLYQGSAHIGIRAAKLLLIDEVSMVSEGLLSFVNEVCRSIRRRPEPFGGLQLAFFGDFLQLPPVSKNNTPDEESCWEGACWKSANLETVLLTSNFRQKDDPAFFALLNNLRYNRLTEADQQVLYQRNLLPPDWAIRLFATNQEVDNYNSAKFNALDPSTERSYTATSRGKQSLVDAYWRNSIMPEKLVLRKGARVMMCVNKNTDHGYLYNGACGEVLGFTSAGYPEVEFDSGLICTIEKEIIYSYLIRDDADVILESAEIVHVPLKLAWACTIHKSQGQTFDVVAIDCAQVFDHGQVYVAMSRARSLSGLYITNLFAGSRGATSDPYIVNKYLQLEQVAVPLKRKSLLDKYFS